MGKFSAYGVEATVIGITGKARSGKDTAAEMLAQALRNKVGPVYTQAMAGTLKAMLLQLFESCASPEADAPFHSLQCVSGDLKEHPHSLLGKSPREMMQTLGTDWGRLMVCEDIWIRVMRNRIERMMYKHAAYDLDKQLTVIIPDIRYANEGALCDTIVRIIREDAQEVSPHQSEAGVPDEMVSITIANNEDLAALEKRMCAAANLIYTKEYVNARSTSNAA